MSWLLVAIVPCVIHDTAGNIDREDPLWTSVKHTNTRS